MKANWTYADLIDLEYCLSRDKESAPAALHRRDRQIYLEFKDQSGTSDRESLIYQWLLNRKRQLFGNKKSPGQTVSQSFRNLSFIIIVCASIVGLVSGLAFFTYSGTTPVNVLNFLFIFLFSQLLMLAFLALAAGIRMIGFDIVPAPVVSFYGVLTAWLFNRSKKLTGHLSAEQVDTFSHLEGLFKKRQSIYARAFYWPLFRLSQQAMAGFNLGLLTATLFRILTSDIAFGWQSTIQFSTEFMGRVTSTLALPWSWFVPRSYAYPSVAQIEGSRIILKDGIYHLQTQDLVSWWPFLVLCILFYGVIVRLLLLLISRAGQWRARRKLKLNRPELIQLTQRLSTPLMSSRAQPAAADTASPPPPESNSGSAAPSAPLAPLSIQLLTPADISENYDLTLLKRSLTSLGLSISSERVIQENFDSDQLLLGDLPSYSWQDDEAIVIIMESWMPPIQETLSFIRNLRAAAGVQIPIFVGLIGQGTGGGNIEAPAPLDWKVWQRKLDGLGDPYLSLLDLTISQKP